jgi:NAD(P)-dependent dehydrogenase (short-subunit alcohol dehydrogenase family)
MTPIRFDGRVAVVTGAGRGLGRAYALELASRGASVVVNDLGGSVAGEGASLSPAEEVVEEIVAAGGSGVASGDDVSTPEGAEQLMALARARYGRIDAVVCNAGILRDRTLVNMPPEDFALVLKVHVLGTAYAVRAALPAMREQQYGRVVVTTSHSGIFGNFGQTNYATAKLGLVGFMLALKEEGLKYGILANAVAPLASTRLGAGVFPAALEALLTPGRVAPVVTWLCSEACTSTGQVVLCGAGRIARVEIVQNAGIALDDRSLTAETIASRWGEITDMTGARSFPNSREAFTGWLGLPAFVPKR